MNKLFVTLLICFAVFRPSADYLTWTLSTGDVERQILHFGTKSGEYDRIQIISAGTNIQILSNLHLVKGVKYYFVVAAVNESGESGFSNEVNWIKE